MATGWQKLGEMLAGGGGGDEAYRARMMENARMGTALGQDRALRLKEAALLGLDEALIGLGNSPDQARAFGALGRADLNPEQFTGAGIDLGTRRAQDAAFAAVQKGGGLEAAAPYLALQEGKAIPTVDVKGDTLFNPYGTLDQALVPTPLGEARIGERQAAAGAQGALDWRRRNAPFSGAAGAGGTSADGIQYEGPVTTGPRGMVITSTGDKVLDRQNYTRTLADVEIIDTINSIREVADDERNFGAVGAVRSTIQDLIQQGDATAQQFGGEAARVRNEIQSGAADVDLGLFNPNIPAINLYNNVLAFKLARSLDPSGRLSNDDVKRAQAAIGNPQGILGNREKYLSNLESIEREAKYRIDALKPRQRLNSGGLPQALGIEGDDSFNSLDPNERVKAATYNERGIPFHIMDGKVMEGLSHGAGDTTAGGQRRIRYDAQGNRIQ